MTDERTLRAAVQMIENAAESEIGPTGALFHVRTGSHGRWKGSELQVAQFVTQAILEFKRGLA
jgi:hypothetical protein